MCVHSAWFRAFKAYVVLTCDVIAGFPISNRRFKYTSIKIHEKCLYMSAFKMLPSHILRNGEYGGLKLWWATTIRCAGIPFGPLHTRMLRFTRSRDESHFRRRKSFGNRIPPFLSKRILLLWNIIRQACHENNFIKWWVDRAVLQRWYYRIMLLFEETGDVIQNLSAQE